ncbi:MAG: choice-of-anchor tandem repeat GloVer-containing protein [Rhodanobacteraceae bacterium]
MTKHARMIALVVIPALGVLAAPCANATPGQISLLASFDFTTTGASPGGTLIDVGGTLYGTTLSGGPYGNQIEDGAGVLFSYVPGTNTLTPLVDFNGINGTYPAAALTNVGGTLHGTTNAGGANGDGVLFSYAPGTNTLTPLANFDGSNGAAPAADLADVNGTLYGTTSLGGAGDYGALYSYVPGTHTLTVLESLANNSTGTNPTAGFTDVGGTLYAPITIGGPDSNGIVVSYSPGTGVLASLASFDGALYSYVPGTNTLTLLASFDSNDGTNPESGLTDVNGTLYGTTVNGGTSNDGVVFSYTPSTGTLATLASLDGSDGALPVAGLTDVDGTLYGTTSSGGAHDDGTLFSFALPEEVSVPGPPGLGIFGLGALLIGLLANLRRRADWQIGA